MPNGQRALEVTKSGSHSEKLSNEEEIKKEGSKSTCTSKTVDLRIINTNRARNRKEKKRVEEKLKMAEAIERMV